MEPNQPLTSLLYFFGPTRRVTNKFLLFKPAFGRFGVRNCGTRGFSNKGTMDPDLPLDPNPESPYRLIGLVARSPEHQRISTFLANYLPVTSITCEEAQLIMGCFSTFGHQKDVIIKLYPRISDKVKSDLEVPTELIS